MIRRLFSRRARDARRLIRALHDFGTICGAVPLAAGDVAESPPKGKPTSPAATHAFFSPLGDVCVCGAPRQSSVHNWLRESSDR